MSNLKDKLAKHKASKAQKGDSTEKVSDVKELLGGGEPDLSVLVNQAKSEGRFITADRDEFHPDSGQPRKTFDESALEGLTQSIESKGQLQPILVKPSGRGGYAIIAGERRWRAICASESVKTVDAILASGGTDDLSILLMQVEENNQREQIPAIENAFAMQRVLDLCKEQGKGHGDAAALLGISKGALSKHLALLKAPESIKDLSTAGEIQDVEVLYMLSQASAKDEGAVSKLIDDWRNETLGVGLRKALRDMAAQGKGEQKGEGEKSSSKKGSDRKPSVNAKDAEFSGMSKDGAGYLFELALGKQTVKYKISANELKAMRDKFTEFLEGKDNGK